MSMSGAPNTAESVRVSPPGNTPIGEIVSARRGCLSGWIEGVATGSCVSLLADGRVVGTEKITQDKTGRFNFRYDISALPTASDGQDGVAFTLELSRAPGVAIARFEGSRAQVWTLDDIDVVSGTSKCEGCVDGIFEGRLRGWVWDTARPERRLEVMALSGNLMVGRGTAEASRSDLADTGRGDGFYGFAIPIRGEIADASPLRILAMVSPGRFWPLPIGRPALDGVSGAETVPDRLRRATTELAAFARALTTSEAFPKKVFLLDKVKHGPMPDSSKADYVVLALEFLRVELLKAAQGEAATWRERVALAARRRKIEREIRVLESMAKAIAANAMLLDRAFRKKTS